MRSVISHTNIKIPPLNTVYIQPVAFNPAVEILSEGKITKLP
jgi:hypothetical protein